MRLPAALTLVALAALPACPSGPPSDATAGTSGTSSTGALSTGAVVTSTGTSTDALTTTGTTAPGTTGTSAPFACAEGEGTAFIGGGIDCEAGQLCIAEIGGDVCQPELSCADLPAGCTLDDLCAAACAGICNNYNCPFPDQCGLGGWECGYDCRGQSACKLPGTACKPIAHNLADGWFQHHCVPTPDPGAMLGEPCTFTGDDSWIWDTCAPGGICWNIDPDTQQGTCYPRCGLFEDPPCDTCIEIADVNPFVSEKIAVCATPCDPLAPDCPPADVCVPLASFVCVLDASGDSGALFDPCLHVNACDPGLVCADPTNAADCAPDSGCCLPLCDTDTPACPGALECSPFYMPGDAPPGLEDVGLCADPP